jgi:hypothetical protein
VTVRLWHASEDDSIELFQPHRAPTSDRDEDLVWAIDDEHLPAYFFPRDCPRATFWRCARTEPLDTALLCGAERVHAIEWSWWERFRDARIFLYQLPADSFEIADVEAGYYTSRNTVRPIERTLIADVVQKHADLGIELRIVESLWPLWDRVIASTLCFSGIRLRNAAPRSTAKRSALGMPSAAFDSERSDESGTAKADRSASEARAARRELGG